MNKILYVARKARGLTEVQLANILQIEESAYKEFEYSINDIPTDMALRLGKLFDIEPDIFLFNEGRSTRLVKIAMDEVTTILQNCSNGKIEPGSYLNVISLGNKALMLQENLTLPYIRFMNCKMITKRSSSFMLI